MHPLEKIIKENKSAHNCGIYSCCSANGFVLQAALERAAETGSYLLVEATANQVDQYGGYTGMTPANFRDYVRSMAEKCGFPQERLILGGDHLGPLTFSSLPEDEAMEKAEELVRCYVLAGFTKIHLDTSMKLGSDNKREPLPSSVAAARGARLCAVCEQALSRRLEADPSAMETVYIVGSEVPIPGGAQEAEDKISVTKKSSAVETIAAYKKCFEESGLKKAWSRVIGLVVQPGVEFGDSSVFEYDHLAAAELCTALSENSQMTFEAHSTDYQTKEGLRELVQDGFSILKVGPALTFALREALFSLDMMEAEMSKLYGFTPSCFRETLEAEMLSDAGSWKRHYFGNVAEIDFKLAYSFSDRARYYLPNARVAAAQNKMLQNMCKHSIPLSLLSQYMPMQYTMVREKRLKNDPIELIKSRIKSCIDEYLFATGVLA